VNATLDFKSWALSYVPMNGENWLLVTKEPVEFKNNQLKFKTLGKEIHHFRGLYGIYIKLIKKNRRTPTCDWLD
jgi:hypothetical protein